MVERLEAQSPGPVARKRLPLGEEDFRLGTTANHVCEQIRDKYGDGHGIWMLQIKVKDPENHSEVEDDAYVTVKDSKYLLEMGKFYSVVQFTGADVFLNL